MLLLISLFSTACATDGADGEDGEQGPQGEQGIQGEQGLPGNDCSAEDVAQVLASDAAFQQSIADQLTMSGVPTGTVVAFAGPSSSVPDGWLICDGQDVSRTQYSSLFDVISVSHGIGDGVNTFNLPDYRGRFLRGVDAGVGRDPDASARTSSGNNGNTGDDVGTVQGFATALPITPFTTSTTGNHTHSYSHMVQTTAVNVAGGGPHDIHYGSGTTGSSGDHNHAISSGGDNETRPGNISVHYIIKY